MAASEQLGVLTHSPMAAGLLSGKYLEDPGKGRLVENKFYQARYDEDDYRKTGSSAC